LATPPLVERDRFDGDVSASREVAACILFLAPDDASYLTGTLLFVDGGYIAM
jgi:NAD(P)-dependent dehydrogenase (short-subunit alcohol dehydrogenase family)